ncbi:MAG: hypothetical protein M3Q69_19870, partial [Acidobacteriota bacterium]|nr:hypothetical protein [Acidobacteriota bacterium]
LWTDQVLSQQIPRLPDELVPLAEKMFLPPHWGSRARFFFPRWRGRSSGELRKALERINARWDKDRTLAAIVPILPHELIDEAFRIAIADRRCPVALDVMAPRLSNEQLATAVSSVQASAVAADVYPPNRDLHDVITRRRFPPHAGGVDCDRLHDLVLRAEMAVPSDRAGLLSEARRNVATLRSDRDRALVLGAIGVLSDEPEQRRACLVEALRVIRRDVMRRWSGETVRSVLLELIPELSIDLLRDVLAIAITMEHLDQMAPVVRAVIPRLPEAAGVECLRLVADEWHVLVPPAHRVSEERSERALRFVKYLRKMPRRWRRQLEGTVPPGMRARILAWLTRRTGVYAPGTIEAIRRGCHPREQIALLLDLLPRLERRDYGNAVAQAMIAALAMHDAAERSSALETIGAHLHPFFAKALRFASGADAGDAAALRQLGETGNADLIAQRLEQLDGESRERLLGAAVAVIRSLEVEEMRAWAELQLAPWMTEAEGGELIQKALNTYSSSTNSPDVVERWASHQSPLPVWVTERLMARRGWEHARVLSALAPHLPDAVLVKAIDHYFVRTRWSMEASLAPLGQRMTALASPRLHPLWRKALRYIAYTSFNAAEVAAMLPVHDRLGGDYA